ncbi:putative Mg2+ transporter-C (MgtC) family protein [Phyllobacterium sp. 1468]|uniref:MgtC/SapB family protein n=1 Tax=Phyllobacterium sp. 1468 TaxID=2817759 RepID=UPI00286040B9|nr:MgtC/SapB family protein [Phyllobacterium sp. 1468]MDR6634697.1 putative Mg2+ transporter-C (MgtC) family protein [Phyllobacterium sp. 1468]
MPLNPTLEDIVVRLLLTVAAGAIIGLDREAGGRAAGFRTTILVGLAACAAMIQANLLLSTDGKEPGFFVNMDVLRLPLGILTGVGFIGGGAIFKRGDIVTGVTTAATLWVMTAIGLAFGGGQLALAGMVTALAFLTLWALKWLDNRIPREHRAILSIIHTSGEPLPDIESGIRPLGYRARFVKKVRSAENGHSIVSYEIRWRRPETGAPPTDLLEFLEKNYSVDGFDTIRQSD